MINPDHLTVSRTWITRRIEECKRMEYSSFSQTTKSALEEVLRNEIKMVPHLPISEKVQAVLDHEEMIESVLQMVCANFNVLREDLTGGRRRGQHPEKVLPRQITAWLLRNTTRLTLQQVAEIMHCDHCTVIHSCKKIGGYVKVNKNGDGKVPFEMLAELTKC